MIDIGGILKGAHGIIDELKTTDEERSKAKAALLKVENNLSEAVLEHEEAIVASARDIIITEAQSASSLARNWRPILMIVITSILAHKYLLFPYLSRLFDAPEMPLPPELFTLLTVGVGGYIVGRSGEKIVSTLRAGETVNAKMSKDLKHDRKMLKRRRKLGLE